MKIMDYFKKFMDRDLPIGQKYETWFATNFLDGEFNANDNNEYDIECNNITYEIKCDSKCFVYYRFGFEVSSRGKLSGINVSKADKWVCIVPIMNKVVIMDIKDIKKFMVEHKTSSVFRPAGDGKSSKMMLWDWDYFMDNFENKEIIDTSIPNFYGVQALEKLLDDARKYIKFRIESIERREENNNVNQHYLKLTKKL